MCCVLLKSLTILVPEAPANEAVEYELHSFTMNDMNKGPFSGLPRDEVNQNWHNLLNGM